MQVSTGTHIIRAGDGGTDGEEHSSLLLGRINLREQVICNEAVSQTVS